MRQREAGVDQEAGRQQQQGHAPDGSCRCASISTAAGTPQRQRQLPTSPRKIRALRKLKGRKPRQAAASAQRRHLQPRRRSWPGRDCQGHDGGLTARPVPSMPSMKFQTLTTSSAWPERRNAGRAEPDSLPGDARRDQQAAASMHQQPRPGRQRHAWSSTQPTAATRKPVMPNGEPAQSRTQPRDRRAAPTRLSPSAQATTMAMPPPRGVGCAWLASLAGLVEQLPQRVARAIQAQVRAAQAQPPRAPARPDRRRAAIRSPAALCSGLTVPQSLQLGHCQWCARAPKPQRWQR